MHPSLDVPATAFFFFLRLCLLLVVSNGNQMSEISAMDALSLEIFLRFFFRGKMRCRSVLACHRAPLGNHKQERLLIEIRVCTRTYKGDP